MKLLEARTQAPTPESLTDGGERIQDWLNLAEKYSGGPATIMVQVSYQEALMLARMRTFRYASEKVDQAVQARDYDALERASRLYDDILLAVRRSGHELGFDVSPE